MIVPEGHARTHKKWTPRTVLGPVLGPVLGVLGPWFCCFRLLVRTGPKTGPGTGPRTSPDSHDRPGTGLGPENFPDWHPGHWTGSQVVTDCDQLRGTNSLVSRTSSTQLRHKPARAVIDRRAVICLTFSLILVVVEDPWIYSARESNTSSQTAPDWDQPG